MPGKMENFGFFLTRAFATTKGRRRKWPFVPGKYFVNIPTAPVAVTTLGSVDLAPQVAKSPPDGLCIVGKVETENIGIEKVIKNILSNPSIRYLVCAGKEPPKHLTGATIISLFENGIDERNNIIGSPGMRPQLPNTTQEEVRVFRERIQPVDMIGCTDVAEIHTKVEELVNTPLKTAGKVFESSPGPETATDVNHVFAEPVSPMRIKLDKGGYFVINIQDGALLVEHYDYKEKLLRIIEGPDARTVYLTIISNGWVEQLDHAAYLGAQLMKAELSQKYRFDFKQDGA